MLNLKICLLLSLILLINISNSVIIQDKCKWTDPKGNQYDFSKLDNKPYWRVVDQASSSDLFGMVYYFNFCDIKEVYCNDQSVVAYEGLEVMEQKTDNCEIMAFNTGVEFSHIDNDVKKGVQIKYENVQNCIDASKMPPLSQQQQGLGGKGKPVSLPPVQTKKVSFNVYCSNSDENQWTLDTSNYCDVKFSIKRKAGCQQSLFGDICFISVLFWVVFIIVGVEVVGYLINKYKYGLEEKEDTIPFYDFWNKLPENIGLGIKFMFGFIRNISQKFQKNSESSHGYNNI